MKIAKLVACLLLFVAIEAAAEEKAKRESVETLMEVTEVSKMVDAIQTQVGGMFEGIAEQMKISESERPAFDNYMAKVSQVMREDISWEQMKEPMIEVYIKHFSEEEVQGLITFYRSDIGRSMTKKMPLVMQDSMGISQQMMKRVMPKIQNLAMEMQAEIRKARDAKAQD